MMESGRCRGCVNDEGGDDAEGAIMMGRERFGGCNSDGEGRCWVDIVKKKWNVRLNNKKVSVSELIIRILLKSERDKQRIAGKKASQVVGCWC